MPWRQSCILSPGNKPELCVIIQRRSEKEIFATLIPDFQSLTIQRKEMTQFNVPTRDQVSENNQVIFDQLKAALGFVPNLYATIAHSQNALGNYLQLQNAKTSLSKKEKEVINLVVSQVNACEYCLAAHTVIGKMNGFTDEQVLDLRSGVAPFNAKLDALAKLTKVITENKGSLRDEAPLDAFFAAGYTQESLVDLIMVIADKIVMNYLHNLTKIPVDFPAAPSLATLEV